MYCFDCIFLFRKIYHHHCFSTGPARIRIDVVSILVSVFREDVGHCFVLLVILSTKVYYGAVVTRPSPVWILVVISIYCYVGPGTAMARLNQDVTPS